MHLWQSQASIFLHLRFQWPRCSQFNSLPLLLPLVTPLKNSNGYIIWVYSTCETPCACSFSSQKVWLHLWSFHPSQIGSRAGTYRILPDSIERLSRVAFRGDHRGAKKAWRSQYWVAGLYDWRLIDFKGLNQYQDSDWYLVLAFLCFSAFLYFS